VRILFVCKANICRSPTAAVIAEDMAQRMGLKQLLQFDSAGTHAGRSKARMDSRALTALQLHGYPTTKHKARQVGAEDFLAFDQIVAMDRANLEWLQQACPAHLQSKILLLMPFADGQKMDEVPDPYYGNAAGFSRVVNLCEAGVTGLLRQHAKA
jgi:protein-tyrosine phosphatase